MQAYFIWEYSIEFLYDGIHYQIPNPKLFTMLQSYILKESKTNKNFVISNAGTKSDKTPVSPWFSVYS